MTLLQGCEEAVLLLAETPNDRNSSRYEILMGEKSHVYKVQKDGAKVILGQYDTPGLLDCDNYKQYSLQWSLPILDMQVRRKFGYFNFPFRAFVVLYLCVILIIMDSFQMH